MHLKDTILCFSVWVFAYARYKKCKRRRSQARRLSLLPDGIWRSCYACRWDV